MELLSTVLVQAMLLVDERLPLEVFEKVDGKRQVNWSFTRVNMFHSTLRLIRLTILDHLDLLLELLDVEAVFVARNLSKMVLLVVDTLEVTETLELVQDTHKFSMARMELLHLKLFSLEPIPTEEAVDLEFGARVLQMLLDAFQSLDRLATAKALDIKALTLFIYMLL